MHRHVGLDVIELLRRHGLTIGTDHAAGHRPAELLHPRRPDGIDLLGHPHWRLAHRQRGISSRSEEHTSELQSLMRISYAVFCLKKKKKAHITQKNVYC